MAKRPERSRVTPVIFRHISKRISVLQSLGRSLSLPIIRNLAHKLDVAEAGDQS